MAGALERGRRADMTPYDQWAELAGDAASMMICRLAKLRITAHVNVPPRKNNFTKTNGNTAGATDKQIAELREAICQGHRAFSPDPRSSKHPEPPCPDLLLAALVQGLPNSCALAVLELDGILPEAPRILEGALLVAPRRRRLALTQQRTLKRTACSSQRFSDR